MTWGWLDSVTQQWGRMTGRPVDLSREPWLQGPVGAPGAIADRWLESEAARLGATGGTGVEVAGLVPSMAQLDAPGFSSAELAPHPAPRALPGPPR